MACVYPGSVPVKAVEECGYCMQPLEELGIVDLDVEGFPLLVDGKADLAARCGNAWGKAAVAARMKLDWPAWKVLVPHQIRGHRCKKKRTDPSKYSVKVKTLFWKEAVVFEHMVAGTA